MSALEICAAETGDVATLVSLVGAFRDHLRASTPTDGDLGKITTIARVSEGLLM